MGVKSIKLGATLSFDDIREKDILDKIEGLRSRHKLGEFISHLIRVAFESPEKLNSQAELAGLMTTLVAQGITMDRVDYFNKIENDIEEMKKKVDAIYTMATKNYTMALAGKKIGLEEKSESTLRAQFVLQRQINAMTDSLGVSLREPFESNKIQETREKAEEVIEYMIESYDGILQEIKASSVTVYQVPVEEVPEAVEAPEIVKFEEEPVKLEESEEDNEVIQFDPGAIAALSDFFGEG